MATNYPTSLDVYYDKVDNVSTVWATSFNNMQDAVKALQSRVGINDSIATLSFDYKVGDFFNTGLPRQLYFFMPTPPTGWSTTNVATGCVLALKGGSQDWDDDGGQKLGNWTIDDMQTETHNHRWLASYNADPWCYSWQSDGSSANYPRVSGVTAPMDEAKGLVADYYYLPSDDRNYVEGKHCYTSNTGHTHTFDGDWRPTAAIGILAKYTGA